MRHMMKSKGPKRNLTRTYVSEAQEAGYGLRRIIHKNDSDLAETVMKQKEQTLCRKGELLPDRSSPKRLNQQGVSSQENRASGRSDKEKSSGMKAPYRRLTTIDFDLAAAPAGSARTWGVISTLSWEDALTLTHNMKVY